MKIHAEINTPDNASNFDISITTTWDMGDAKGESVMYDEVGRVTSVFLSVADSEQGEAGAWVKAGDTDVAKTVREMLSQGDYEDEDYRERMTAVVSEAYASFKEIWAANEPLFSCPKGLATHGKKEFEYTLQ